MANAILDVCEHETLRDALRSEWSQALANHAGVGAGPNASRRNLVCVQSSLRAAGVAVCVVEVVVYGARL